METASLMTRVPLFSTCKGAFSLEQQDDKIESERLVADVSDESVEGSIGLTGWAAVAGVV